MSTVINFNIDKKTAIKLTKKAISSKVPILKDDGDLLKVGTPPFMVCTIKFSNNSITLDGKAAAAIIASTCSSAIKMAIEEYEEEHPVSNNNNNNPSIDETKLENKGTPIIQNNNVEDINSVKTPKKSETNIPATLTEYYDYQKQGCEILVKIKELFDKGIITEEEYNNKKEEIISFMNGVILK